MMKLAPSLLLVLALALGGCKKKEAAAPAESQAAATTPTPTAAEPPATPPADAGPSEADRVTAAREKMEASMAEEAKRWTPELEARATKLRDAKYKSTDAALIAILASDHRTPGHAERDAARHPVETLKFFGLEPKMTVVELGAGGGWYTELLAPLLANRGKLIVAGPAAEGPADKMTTVYGQRLDRFLAKSPGLFGKVERIQLDGEQVALGEPARADLVLAIRELHNWYRRGQLEAYLRASHEVLKDGGTLGIVAHRAPEGADPKTSAENGYLPEAWVVEQVQAAGFELVEKSDVNANPKDTKDYAKGVWTLPPNFREGEADRAKYAAIGESDRMTLKFKKVAAPAGGGPAAGADSAAPATP